jgi:O-antigen/teichoic acid export membrane protein
VGKNSRNKKKLGERIMTTEKIYMLITWFQVIIFSVLMLIFGRYSDEWIGFPIIVEVLGFFLILLSKGDKNKYKRTKKVEKAK